MNEIDKLRVLIPHWIEHNTEHAQEFREWAAKANEVQADLLSASRQMEEVNRELHKALDKLGGPLENQSFHSHE